jgi:hypothetical protein
MVDISYISKAFPNVENAMEIADNIEKRIKKRAEKDDLTNLALLVASCKYTHKCAVYVDRYNDLRTSLEREGLSKEVKEEKIRKWEEDRITKNEYPMMIDEIAKALLMVKYGWDVEKAERLFAPHPTEED